MSKSGSFFLGAFLVVAGAMALVLSLFSPWFAFSVAGFLIERGWPLIVIGVGLAICALPLLLWGQRWAGLFLIPGMPVLVTGVILLFANTFHAWWAWNTFWPLEVLAVAAGFLLAALVSGIFWLVIPAILVGVNGLVLMFTNFTGMWDAWSVLWTVEPLALGLALLVADLKAHTRVLSIVGGMFCAFAGVSLAIMTTFSLFGTGLLRLLGPVMIMTAGFVLLMTGLLTRGKVSLQDQAVQE